jgi:hypothetical protein
MQKIILKNPLSRDKNCRVFRGSLGLLSLVTERRNETGKKFSSSLGKGSSKSDAAGEQSSSGWKTLKVPILFGIGFYTGKIRLKEFDQILVKNL